MIDTPNGNDTSADAVERHLDMDHNHEADLIPAASKKMIRTLAAERDALKAELQDAEDRANAFATKEMHTATERDALKAKLDEALEALEWISTEESLDHINGNLWLTDGAIEARATLAKLKGETDE